MRTVGDPCDIHLLWGAGHMKSAPCGEPIRYPPLVGGPYDIRPSRFFSSYKRWCGSQHQKRPKIAFLKICIDLARIERVFANLKYLHPYGSHRIDQQPIARWCCGLGCRMIKQHLDGSCCHLVHVVQGPMGILPYNHSNMQPCEWWGTCHMGPRKGEADVIWAPHGGQMSFSPPPPGGADLTWPPHGRGGGYHTGPPRGRDVIWPPHGGRISHGSGYKLVVGSSVHHLDHQIF